MMYVRETDLPHALASKPVSSPRRANTTALQGNPPVTAITGSCSAADKLASPENPCRTPAVIKPLREGYPWYGPSAPG
jgi:hypothetical protein